MIILSFADLEAFEPEFVLSIEVRGLAMPWKVYINHL